MIKIVEYSATLGTCVMNCFFFFTLSFFLFRLCYRKTLSLFSLCSIMRNLQKNVNIIWQTPHFQTKPPPPISLSPPFLAKIFRTHPFPLILKKSTTSPPLFMTGDSKFYYSQLIPTSLGCILFTCFLK